MSCKIRLDNRGTSETVRFARALQAAGCDLLAVHCRHRGQKHDGTPDFETGAQVVKALSIPVVINGGIASVADARRVLELTGAHGVMVAQAFLQNPRCMSQCNNAWSTDTDDIGGGGGAGGAGGQGQVSALDVAEMAAEYLDLACTYPPPTAHYIRKHMRWLFRTQLSESSQWPPQAYSEKSVP